MEKCKSSSWWSRSPLSPIVKWDRAIITLAAVLATLTSSRGRRAPSMDSTIKWTLGKVAVIRRIWQTRHRLTVIKATNSKQSKRMTGTCIRAISIRWEEWCSTSHLWNPLRKTSSRMRTALLSELNRSASGKITLTIKTTGPICNLIACRTIRCAKMPLEKGRRGLIDEIGTQTTRLGPK